MPDYKALYFTLFRATAAATEALLLAQQQAEETFLQAPPSTAMQLSVHQAQQSTATAPVPPQIVEDQMQRQQDTVCNVTQPTSSTPQGLQ